jgi:hypothetical protein
VTVFISFEQKNFIVATINAAPTRWQLLTSTDTWLRTHCAMARETAGHICTKAGIASQNSIISIKDKGFTKQQV